MVLLVLAIAAALAAPAYARFGAEQPEGSADRVLGLLRDARKAAMTFNATTTLRLDPKTLKYALDTSGINGAGRLAEGTLFPPMLAQLIGVGEDSGQLRVFLMKAADIFEERTERATQRLATLAEPAMIVVFGVIVAFVALSLLQAIYGINANSFK